MKDITARFLEVYEYLLQIKKISNSSDFAKKIGISISMMNEITKGRSNVGVKAIHNTVRLFKNINIDWLLLGTGKMHKDFKIERLHTDADEELAIKIYGIPLIPADAFAGIGFNVEYSIILDIIEDRYIIPLFEDKSVDFLIKVRGSSMYPKYNSGDVVACKLIHERLFIQWNKIHVIYTSSQGAMIKRLRKAKDEKFITCRSENSEYDDFDIPVDDIQNIAIVIGSVRLE